MLCPQHFLQQILSGTLLLAIIGEEKNNFSGRFNIEPVTT